MAFKQHFSDFRTHLSRQVRGWGYAGQIGIGQTVKGNRKSKVSRSYVFDLINMKSKWILNELVDMFSLDKTFLNWVPFLKLSFFIHEDRYKGDSKHIFLQLLSVLFFVPIRILKFFSSHHLCIKLWRIQKYKFYWYKPTTAWVISLGPKNSCIWP